MRIYSTTFINSICAVVFAVCVAGCSFGEKITLNKNEPAWVNNTKSAQKEADAIVVGVGSAKLLDGNVDYATNIAAANARAQIAQSINSKLEQAIKQLQQADGLVIKEDSLIATKQLVKVNLQQTKLVARWVDKEANPKVLYVLVSMDKEAYESALRGALDPVGVDSKKAKLLSDTVEDMIR